MGRILLGDLARLAGVSNGHFCRAFKQTFGMSAHSFLMRRRIEFAQGAMLRTEMPLSEIALNCGLSDQSHFTRAFRRIVGETPHAWRRARRDALDRVQAVRAEAGGSSCHQQQCTRDRTLDAAARLALAANIERVH